MLMKATRSPTEWQKSLAHASIDQLKTMQRENLVDGLNIASTTDEGCADCQLGKATRVPHPESGRDKASTIGDVVQADLVGPIDPTGLGGSRYILIFTDEFSNYRTTYCLKSKDEVADRIQKFAADIECETGYKLKVLRTDRTSLLTGKSNLRLSSNTRS